MNWKSVTLQSAYIGLFAAIIGGLISSNLSKNNEIEARVFEVKENTYSKFIESYYKNYNSDSIKKEYEQKYSDMITKSFSGENSIMLEKAKSCYYSSPKICLNSIIAIGTNTEEIYHTTYRIIGLHQLGAFLEVLMERNEKFENEILSTKLLMPTNIYLEGIDLIQIATNFKGKKYRQCEYSIYEEECGFDFNLYSSIESHSGSYEIDGYNTHWINFNFYRPDVIWNLKRDLESHYGNKIINTIKHTLISSSEIHYIAKILIVISALFHLYVLRLEMFARTTRGKKVFTNFPKDLFEKTKTLAANQGLYNGFLAAGLIWSLCISDPVRGRYVAIFFLSCVIIAGIYGGITADKKIFFTQAVPALLAWFLLLIQ